MTRKPSSKPTSPLRVGEAEREDGWRSAQVGSKPSGGKWRYRDEQRAIKSVHPAFLWASTFEGLWGGSHETWAATGDALRDESKTQTHPPTGILPATQPIHHTWAMPAVTSGIPCSPLQRSAKQLSVAFTSRSRHPRRQQRQRPPSHPVNSWDRPNSRSSQRRPTLTPDDGRWRLQ